MQRARKWEAAVKSWITNYKSVPIFSIMKRIPWRRTKSSRHAETMQNLLINRQFNFYHHLLQPWQQFNFSHFVWVRLCIYIATLTTGIRPNPPVWHWTMKTFCYALSASANGLLKRQMHAAWQIVHAGTEYRLLHTVFLKDPEGSKQLF